MSLAVTLSQPVQTLASTSNTINFQARLENISGAIVPDGNYNVEFRLYTAASGGTLLWTEDYLNSASQGISVANGYLTANLGSITAFPTTINWDQQLWLTMNIGGTTTSYIGPYSLGNSAWDGEMSPRLPLTAVPYSFRSGQAGGLFDPGGSGSVLNWNSPSSNYTLTLPNESGTLCTNATGGTCSSLYIQNQTASPQSSAGFNISGSGTFGGNLTFSGSSAATIQGPTSGLTVNNTSGNLTLSTTTSGTLALTSAGNITETPSSTGTVLIGNSAGNGSITLGSSSSGQSVYIANGAGAATVNIANISTVGNSVSIAGDNSTAIDTINIGTGSTSVAGGKTINIGNGTPTGSGTNIISIGATTNGSTVTLQGGAASEQLTNSGDKISISNASNAFQVSNGTNNVFSVSTNTTTPQAVLGTNTNLAGSLLFNTTSSGNPITLQATTDSTSGGYTLSLPTSAPAGGLCLQTSSTYTASTGQLVFGQCSNSNASVSLVSYNDNHGTSSSTVSSVTNTTSNIGDLIVVTAQVPSGTAITGISGGNVTTWSRVGFLAGDGTVNRVEMWMGTVTSVGSSTISLSPSGSLGNNDEITETEYTASGVNTGTTWGVDTEATNKSTGSSTVTFPTLTPQSQGELYEGYAQVQHTPASAGSSSGFSYQVTGQTNVIAYDTNVNPIAAFTPTASQSSSGEADTIAAIFTPFVSSTAINNSIVPQLANFDVQASSSGAPAATLQASVGDTTDNLLNFYGDTTGQTSANEVLSITEPGNIQFGGLSNQTISVTAQTATNTAGANLTVSAATGNGSGAGGSLTISGGNAGATSGANGGAVYITGGTGTGTGSTGSINIGTNAVAQTISIGSNTGTSSLSLQSGTGGVLFNLGTSTTAFQIQNTSGVADLTVNTSSNSVTIGNYPEISSWTTDSLNLYSNTKIYDAASATANGYIYEIGGATDTHGYCQSGGSSPTTINTVSYALSNVGGSTGSWATTTSLPSVSLCALAATAVNGYLYVFGGNNGTSDSANVYSALICTGFNSGVSGCGATPGTIGTWNTSLNALPSAEDSGTAVTANGFVYVAGGEPSLNSSGNGDVFYALACTGLNSGVDGCGSTAGTVGTWNTSSVSSNGGVVEEWPAVAYSGGYLYMSGGWSGGLTKTIQFTQLNPSTGAPGTWTTNNSALLTAISSASSVAANGYLYIFSGLTTVNSTATLSAWATPISSINGSIGTVSTISSLPTKVANASAIDVNNYVYVLGGETSGTGSAEDTVYYSSLGGTSSLVDDGALTSGGQSTFEDVTNSTTAFQVQNNSGSSLLTVDSYDNYISLGAASATPVELLLGNKNTSGDPATEIDGAMYYNSSTGNFRCGESGLWENCLGGLITSNTAPSSAVSSCTSACSSFSTNAAIPAGYCTPGRVIEITANGTYSTASGTSPTLGYGIYMGSSPSTATSDTLIGGASAPLAAGNGVTNYGWGLNFTIICDSSGSSGTVTGEGNSYTVVTTTTENNVALYSSTTTTINTTAAQNIYLFPTWGTSSASNSITCDEFIVTGK